MCAGVPSLLTLSSSLNITTNVTPGLFSTTLRELDTDAAPIRFSPWISKYQQQRSSQTSCHVCSSHPLIYYSISSDLADHTTRLTWLVAIVWSREWKEKVMALPSTGRCDVLRCDVLCVDAKDVSWQHMYSECECLPMNTILAHQYSRRSCFASQLLVKNKRRDLKRASLQSKHLMYVWYDFNKVQDKAHTELWQSRILKGLSVKLEGEIISSFQVNLPLFSSPFFSTYLRRFFIFNVPLWSTLCFRHAWIVLNENLTHHTTIQKCFLTVWKTHIPQLWESSWGEALVQRKIHYHMHKHYCHLKAY